MNTSNFLLKTIVVAGTLLICVFAAVQHEWLWSGFFLIHLLERYVKFKEDIEAGYKSANDPAKISKKDDSY